MNIKKSFILSILSVLVSTILFSNTNVTFAAGELGLEAESAVLLDAKTGKILYQKNPDLTLPPASMTKMMTEYLILEAVNDGRITWEQETKISDYVYRISQNRGLSNVPLRKDGSYNVKELYEAMAIYSANGATIALAELVGGSETSFVQMMNDKAKELKLENYKFVNTTGLNNSDLLGMHPAGTENEENMLSARDTAKLAYHLITDFPEVLKTSGIPKKTFREGTDDAINMSNWNWMLPGLVYEYEGMDGIKTGSTSLAGYSFTATAERNGMRLITVVMKTNSYKARFEQTRKLMDYGFSNFTEKQLFPSNYQIEGESVLPVIKGKEDQVEIASNAPITVMIKRNEDELYGVQYKIDETLLTEDGEITAPVEKGQKVGTLQLTYNNDEDFGYITENRKSELEVVDVVTTSSIEKANWFVLSMRGIGGFFSDIWTSVANTVKGMF